MDELQQQGQLDSSGRFTMDPKRAQELLRDWQLQERHHYVLCWVSCLVGLGAERIRVSANKTRLVLQAEKLTLPEEVVANPLGSLFAGQVSPPLRELAMGLNSALRYPGCRVTLKCRTGSEELEGRYRAGEFSLQKSASEAERMTEICLERPLKGKESFAPELEVLREKFTHCPVDLWVGDRQISQAVQVPSEGFCIHLKPGQASPASALRVTIPAGAVTLEHPAPVQACIVLGQGGCECHWLVMGRSYLVDLPWQVGDGDLCLRLWVACDSLDKDLSLANLVQNERYQRVVQYLQDCFSAALEQICERLTRLELEDHEVERFRTLLVCAIEASARKGDLELARQLQKSLMRYPDRAGVERYRWDLLLESQLSGHEVLTGTDAAWNLHELWTATRACLAIRGASHRATLKMLLLCSERAFREGHHEITVRCLEPYLQVATDSNGELSNRLGTSLVRLGHFSRAADVLRSTLQRVASTQPPPAWAYATMEELSIVEARLGMYREAAQRLAEVLRYRKASEGSRSRTLGVLLQRLVVLCQQLKDEKTANYYQDWAKSLDR